MVTAETWSWSAPAPQHWAGGEAGTEEVADVGSAALILGSAEALLNRLPTEALANDRLYVRAQALAEVLEAGLAAVDRAGRVNRLV